MIALKASSFATLQFTFNRNRRFHQWLSQANSRKCAVFCSIDRPKWNPRTHSPKHNHNNHSESSGKKKNKFIDDDDDDDEEEEGGERKVHCEVEVISWRERRIKAEILVNADIESVWDALTDYERLADFIPNLVCRYTPKGNSFFFLFALCLEHRKGKVNDKMLRFSFKLKMNLFFSLLFGFALFEWWKAGENVEILCLLH